MKYNLCFTIFLLLFSNSLAAADYFWVGGPGNWSDISHWATTSGGVITHNQAPTADDNVFFDANSFTGLNQVVLINNESIFCRNLDWTGATGTPVFRGDSGKVVNIFGSLNFIYGMIFDFDGEVRFRTAGQGMPVRTAGHRLGREALFEGDGGWILQDSLAVDRHIRFNSGILNTNGHNLNAGYFYINIQDSGQLILANSRITLTGSNIYEEIGQELFTYDVLDFNIEGNFTADPGNSVIELTSNDATARIQNGNPEFQLNDLFFSAPQGKGALVLSLQPVSFGRIRFNGHGALDRHLSAEHLILAPGMQYRFLAGFTYEFDSITATGSCVAPITLQATENNTATFLSNGNQIELDFVNLKNIDATGSAAFIAKNSADLGNNSGWTILPRTVQNLYWVGGAGNWDDPAHWALTSGGPGGACIPSGTDNVFFDQNSFNFPAQVVTINAEDAYCRDMTWTAAANAPSLAGANDRNLHIFGSLALIPEMQFAFGGLLQFESQETGKTVATGNHRINKVRFQGNGGEWTLLDSLKITTGFTLDAGTLNTNSQYIECTSVNSTLGGVQRKMVLGNTHWVIKHLPGANKDQWLVLVNDFELDAGTSTLEFAGEGPGGFLQHTGTGGLQYNRVVFTGDDGFLEDLASGIYCTIDTLIFKKGGYIKEDYRIRSLQLEPGATYLLQDGTVQTIDELVAPASCNALITIRSYSAGNPAFINALITQTDLQYLSLRDVHSIGLGYLAAYNSIDLGNNTGWTISELASRTLFWVGGAGNWDAPDHWSLSSGGPGGECIPTLRDDVVFDGNSFNAPGQQVFGQSLNGYYCRNLTWENNLPDPVFNLNRLYCYGSAVFAQDMVNQLSGFNLSGSGAQTVRFKGQPFQDVQVAGDGAYTFLDDLSADQLFLRSGVLNTNDQDLTLARLIFTNENTQFLLELGRSYITITDPANQVNYSLKAPFGENTVINPGASVIELTHPDAGVLLSGGLTFNNLVFSGVEGLINIVHRENSSSMDHPVRFNLLEVGSDAVINGFNNIDTLIFAPGKSYRLEANVTQTVNEFFKIVGNNCIPLELFSTLPGEKATIFMAQGTVYGEFIQMQDQIAAGGATFYAGVFSTDIAGSNQGWIFGNAPEYINVGFLGQDRAICPGETVPLSAYNYSPGETYTWSTGNSNAGITATEAGLYWARVTFGNMCETVDTVLISIKEPASVDLGPDTRICEGETLVLDASSPDQNVTYRWQDGSTGPTFTVTQAGDYSVELNKGGCLTRDSVSIGISDTLTVNLGPDQSRCEGESIILDAGVGLPAAYQWQDGSGQPTLTLNQSGIYSVTVTAGACTGQDEVAVAFNPAPEFSLGPDTSLCTGETWLFDLSGTGDTYRWQDGASTSIYNVGHPGQYWVEITKNGCVFADTLQIEFFETPVVDLGPDQSLCDGETAVLDAGSSQSVSYQWQDGSVQPTLTVDRSGRYSVVVTANGCTTQDEVSFTFNPIPVFSLGPDTSLCTGQTLVFDRSGSGDAYRWQDGSSSPVYTVDHPGQYWLEVTANSCVFVDTLTVEFRTLPEVNLGSDQVVCDQEAVNLEPEIPEADSFFWQDGSDSPSFTAIQSGVYWVEAILDGCRSRDSVLIRFNIAPDPGLPDSLTLCQGEILRLRPLSLPGSAIIWQDGSNSPEYPVEEAGQYSLTIDNGDCLIQDSVKVILSACGEVPVYVPNAFSPDGDGFNDLFVPDFDPGYEVLDYQIRIFDRWGELVFHSADPASGWDGRVRDRDAGFGVYVYVLRFRIQRKGEVVDQLISGDVNLIR